MAFLSNKRKIHKISEEKQKAKRKWRIKQKNTFISILINYVK